MTFESTPPDYSSVNSPLVYVVYDSNSADPGTYPNYKYVGELYIDGNLVHTERQFPHPDTNRGIFDFADVIREYVINSLDITSNQIVAQYGPPGTWATKAVVVKIREEYGGATGTVVLTDSDRVFYNHYVGLLPGFTYLNNYPESLTTARPERINITVGNLKNYYVPYFAPTAGSFDVSITDDVGTVNTHTVTTPSDNCLVLLNFSAFAINNVFSGFITTNTKSYTVNFSSGNNTLVFNVICKGWYQNYYVHFLNRFGGFETMLFNKVRRQSIEVEKKTWRQLPYRVDGSGVVSVMSAYGVLHDQETTAASRFKKTIKVSTDWLSDTEYEWLADLIASPIVYLEYGGYLYPAKITETNYEIKEYIVDSLQNLAITLDFGTTFKTQFR